MIKWISSSAVLAGALFRNPTLLILIVAVVAVVVVLATYVLAAKREIAPRIKWGNLRINFERIPKRKG
jgi:hypothetical protein